MSLTEIAQGWANFVIQPADIKAQAVKRLKECDECSYRKALAGIQYCGLCGCPLATKTMSPKSSCPNELWGPMDVDSYY